MIPSRTRSFAPSTRVLRYASPIAAAVVACLINSRRSIRRFSMIVVLVTESSRDLGLPSVPSSYPCAYIEESLFFAPAPYYWLLSTAERKKKSRIAQEASSMAHCVRKLEIIQAGPFESAVSGGFSMITLFTPRECTIITIILH